METTPARTPHRKHPAGGCPHAVDARLPVRGAVAPVELPGGIEGMAVLGHEALTELPQHPEVAKHARHFTAPREGRIAGGRPLLTFAAVPGMTTADGDDHRRLRSLAGRAFTPRRVAVLRPRVEELTGALLDTLARAAAAGDGVADLRRHFALPLPTGVDLRTPGCGRPVPTPYAPCTPTPPSSPRPARPGAARHLSPGHGAHYCLGAPLAGWRPRSPLTGCSSGSRRSRL
ncbi:hypothetical protein ABZ299_28025, partial [Streptomyces sp. NPDC006184]